MNNVAGRAYNYEFKMLMEGIEIPFKSANIVCTPNGVEFNINVHVSEELFDIKPKTAVQIFYREWYSPNRAWRLMADGFFSGYVTSEDSLGGRGVGITCRDFRMDIRKSPAAIAYASVNEVVGEAANLFSINGLKSEITTRTLRTGQDAGEDTTDEATTTKRIYDNSGLMDLATAIEGIVGTAYGKSGGPDGGHYSAFNFSTSEVEDASGKKVANGGLFLDAFIRGIWMESVGGTRVNSFLNTRIRADKRFLVPRNYASFNFWKKNNFGIEIGTAIMGNSRFSSLEAAMMNVAGMFSVRVYSCSTPSLISLQEENNPGLEFVMDDQVRQFMAADGSGFGAMYMLNQSMLLPPLEFTAPPNCNLFFPPMYNRLNWQRDEDSDITRGYFGVTHSLTTASGNDFGQVKFQIPNAMFGVTAEKVEGTANRLPLTLEERYKGVNVYHGSVEYNLAAADVAKALAVAKVVSEKGKKKVDETAGKVEGANKKVEKGQPKGGGKPSGKGSTKVVDENLALAKEKAALAIAAKKTEAVFGGAVATAYKRHAMIKYINLKYAGRVITVDMAFNPFVMAGFPGAVISAAEEMNTNVSKTMIGMVQQVSHAIHITPQGADATTTVIMNNVRFEDEPTDLDANGMPLYMKATDKSAAEVNLSTYDFTNSEYYVPNPERPITVDEDSAKFDLKETKVGEGGYVYVKDFLTTSEKDLNEGKTEQIYVDRSYEPNQIFKFYDKVFGHNKPHFMLGKDGNKYFAYDTIHEGLVDLRKNKPELLADYSACMSYVRRNICSADAFYHGILGLSSKELTDDGAAFVNRKSGFLDSIIKPTYYGVPTADFANAEGLNMAGAGEFSSIREHAPITAFIKERRQAVEAYRRSAVRKVTGTVFNNG